MRTILLELRPPTERSNSFESMHFFKYFPEVLPFNIGTFGGDCGNTATNTFSDDA